VILVGVDPGNVTGIAVWWDPDFFDLRERGSTFDVAEVADSTKVVSVIKRMLDGHRPHLMAVEPAAAEVTGAVRSLAEELHVRCVYQSPSPAKKIAPTEVLKRVGWYSPTPDGHQNAALSHVLLLMATYVPVKFAQLVGV
jgi:hypothetical protein